MGGARGNRQPCGKQQSRAVLGDSRSGFISSLRKWGKWIGDLYWQAESLPGLFGEGFIGSRAAKVQLRDPAMAGRRMKNLQGLGDLAGKHLPLRRWLTTACKGPGFAVYGTAIGKHVQAQCRRADIGNGHGPSRLAGRERGQYAFHGVMLHIHGDGPQPRPGQRLLPRLDVFAPANREQHAAGAPVLLPEATEIDANLIQRPGHMTLGFKQHQRFEFRLGQGSIHIEFALHHQRSGNGSHGIAGRL